MRRRAPRALWSAALAARADRHTMEALGLPSAVLMERASLCVAHEVVALRGHEPLPVWILVGPANNGGDGLAVARLLHGWGVDVQAVLVTESRQEATSTQLAWARAHGVPVREAGLGAAPARALVVDAMLGTGARGEPRGGVAAALRWQAGIRGPRVAIDVPTGLDVDRGSVSELAFTADLTVTFGRSKPGLHLTPGRSHAGAVVVADIGLVSPEGDAEDLELIDPGGPGGVAEALASLPPGTHKGQRGHVAVVGGGAGTPGAAVLAATTAMRAGAGLSTIVTASPEVRAQLIELRPELMVAGWDAGSPAPSAKALVVGPGLTDPGFRDRLEALWREDPRPAVWDASALAEVPFDAPPAGPRVLTPHPGEAAAMLARSRDEGWSGKDVQTDRWEAAKRLALRAHAVTVLKGEGTLVVEPQGRSQVAVVGSAVLATAGTGDCLAGLIGALLARGLAAPMAAAAGVHVHGLAGDRARARRPGVMAADVAEAVAEALLPEVLGEPVSGWPRLRRG